MKLKGGNHEVQSNNTTRIKTMAKGGDNNLKVRKILLSLLSLLLIVSVTPKVVLADEENNYQLFQLIEDVHLDEGITILSNTYLYGEKQDNSIHIQYADTHQIIPYDSVNEARVSDEVPEFIDIDWQSSNSSTMSLPVNHLIYSNTTEEAGIFVNEEIEYPIIVNKQGKKIFYFGNIEFHLENNKVATSKEDSYTEQSENNQSDKMGDGHSELDQPVEAKEEKDDGELEKIGEENVSLLMDSRSSTKNFEPGDRDQKIKKAK